MVHSEKVEYLERALREAGDRHSQQVQALHSKVEQLHSHVSNERTMRDSHHKGVVDTFGKEREARERQHASIEERLTYIETYLGESADRHAQDLQNHQGNIQQRLQALEQKLIDELGDIREHLHGERQLRAQHHDAVADHLESERRARDAHERAVQQHLAGEKKARDTHERLIAEQLSHEKSARDRHHEHTRELIGREKEARDKHLSAHQEMLQREGSSRENAIRDLHDTISKERALREQAHGVHHETLQREKASRQRLEDLFAQERAERSKHFDTVGEKVESLSRALSTFDALVHKEMEERTKENRRIWDAIDNHTHDLATHFLEAEPGDKRATSARTASPQTRSVASPTAATTFAHAPRPVSPPAACGVAAEPTSTAFAVPGLAMQRSVVGPVPQGPMPTVVSHMPAPGASLHLAGAPAFDRLDANHDGVITRAEFNQFMQRH